MAARYAVTTGNWTGAIWAATSGGAAGSAAVPTSADDVTINKNVVVTLDATTCVALSVALSVGTTGGDVGGKLTPSLSANSKLTVEQGVSAPGASGGSGSYATYFAFDMSSAPTYTCEVVLNNVNATGAGYGLTMGGNWNLVGAVKKRHTTLAGAISAGATSATVADATGWAVGDKIIFATTSAYSATPATDEVTLTSVNTGTGAIGWTGGTTYAHASGCPAGNFSSNLVIRPGTAGGVAFVLSNGTTANGNLSSYCTDVEFRSTGPGSTFGNGVISINSVNSRVASVSNNAFYDSRGTVIFLRQVSHVFTRSWNVFYTSTAVVLLGGQDVNGNATIGPDEDYAVFRCGAGGSVLQILFPQQHQRRHKLSGCASSGGPTGAVIVNTSKTECIVDGVQIWSCNSGINNALTLNVKNCTFGEQVFAGCNNTSNLSTGDGILTATDCTFPSGVIGRTGAGSTLPNALVKIVNKGGDPDVQEIYGSHSNTVPIIAKSLVAAEFTRSTSALVMTCNASAAITHEISIPAKASTALKLILYCTTSGVNLPVSGDVAYGGSTLPSATLSGLGITPIAATFSGTAGTFQQLTIDLAAVDAPAADGLLTLTLTAQSATAGAQAFWCGIPLMPFVSRCRHYGYLFDETSPTRTADITKSASEATASGYDYGTFTWGSSSSSTEIDTSCTFQQLYDWHQYQACLNVGSAVALTGAGVAGAPSLFAAGDVTITAGDVLNGSGSISMGSYTLSTEFFSGVDYTYTGGTWSQAITVPSFAGGTLTLPTKITSSADFSMTTATIEFGAAGADWNLSDATFNGTITLATTAGQTVTVAMPTGVTVNNTEPGNITVTTPILSANIEWAGALDGTTILLYNDKVGGGLIDTATITGAGGYNLDVTLPSVDVAVGDPLRIRYGHKQYYADEIQGTMTATGWIAVGTMVLHPVYAGWALDGADYDQANGGPYTMDGANLQVDIDSGSTTGLKTQLGAWTQYLMTLPAGLAAFYGAWDLLAVNQIRQNVGVIDVKIDVPTAGALFTFTDNNVNYYRSDFSYPGNVETGHGLIAITYDASPFVATVAGGDVVTGTPASVAAAVRSELGTELTATLEVWRRHGLDIAAPLTQTSTAITAGTIDLAITGDPDVSVTVTRQP